MKKLLLFFMLQFAIGGIHAQRYGQVKLLLADLLVNMKSE